MSRKLNAGDPLSRLSAAEFNRHVDWADHLERSSRLGTGGSPAGVEHQGVIVKIRNDTAGSLGVGAVLEVSSSLISPLERQFPWFAGIARAGNDPTCAVLIDPAESGEFARAQIAGLAIADVDIVDADNTHARVVAGSTQLRGDFGGWARILWKPSSTGVQQCVVIVPSGEQIVRQARASGTINSGSSGTAEIYVNGAVRGTATVWNDWIVTPANIPNGTDLYVQYFHDLDKWRVVGAECV